MTSKREQILQQLAELAELIPEQRIGHLLANAAGFAGDGNRDVWNIEDDRLAEGAAKLLETYREFKARGSQPADSSAA